MGNNFIGGSHGITASLGPGGSGAGWNLVVSNNVFNSVTNAVGTTGAVNNWMISNNLMSNVLTPYSVAAAATNMLITDTNNNLVAGLPPCAVSLNGSTFNVGDATTPTYNGALTGGGSVSVLAKCVGSAGAWRSQ